MSAENGYVGPVVEVHNATRSFGGVHAVNGITLTIDGHGIYGLLGRNGAGKTTLMQLLTGQDFPTSGSIEVFGEQPAENSFVLSRVCFTKESQAYPDSFKVKHLLRVGPHLYRNWDGHFASVLLSDFKVPLNTPIKKMSRGQRSAVGVAMGLASRAPLTLLDEPYAGLDAVARHIFYDHLHADHAANPRTFILSTHLIDEASHLLSHVFVIDEGKIIIDSGARSLCEAAEQEGRSLQDIIVSRTEQSANGIGVAA